MAHGKKRGSTRGRHKKHSSRETLKWNEEHLVPKCPSWLKHETYVKLAKLRNTM